MLLKRYLPAFLMYVAIMSMSAQATTYSIEGTFGTTYFGGPLNGGSFSGTYEVSGLPLADGQIVKLQNWDVVLRDSANVVLAAFNPSDGDVCCNVVDASFSPFLPVTLYFSDRSSNWLDLKFSDPFNGVGSLIPFDTGTGEGSYASIGGNSGLTNFSTVNAGASSLLTPEPASSALFSCGALMSLVAGFRVRRQLRGAKL